jgi:hypothetical protein
MTSDYTSLLSLNVMRAGRYEGVDTPPELSERPKLLATPLYKNETVVRAAASGLVLLLHDSTATAAQVCACAV